MRDSTQATSSILVDAILYALQMEVVKSHGCICLKGPAVMRIASHALSCFQSLHPDSPAPVKDTPSLNEVSSSCRIMGPGSATSLLAICRSTLNTLRHQTHQSEMLELQQDNSMHDIHSHVTLITKEELAACTISRSDLLREFQLLDTGAFFPVGIAVAGANCMPHTDAAVPATIIGADPDDESHTDAAVPAGVAVAGGEGMPYTDAAAATNNSLLVALPIHHSSTSTGRSAE